MMILRVMICSLTCVGTVLAGIAEQAHPRLLFPAREEAQVKKRIADDPLAAAVQETTMAEAKRILKSRTCRYEIPDGKRLLRESRLAIHNITHTAMAWRLNGGEEYRRRVIAELDAACALKDWNPSHFLDTAEMAAAVAIGYDWLYPSLTPEQRRRYEDALIGKGLKPAKRLHDTNAWWTRGKNNWAQVCAAGIGMAAAVVWEREPKLCGELFETSIRLVEHCGVFYRPEGVYPEGPSYWHYGTNYHVLLLATCASLQEDIEVEPTLRPSGGFILQSAGPSGRYFNFADSHAREAVPTPAQAWIARHFKNPVQAGLVRASIADKLKQITKYRYCPLHLLWLPEEVPADAHPPLQSSVTFSGEQAMGFFRTGWEQNASWLAIKGGTGAASHGHLDAGSFVYEAKGIRWFVDLGSDNYNLPSYFGDKRWEYFRLTNRSHNTLIIDDLLQAAPKAPCPITASGTDKSTAWLSIDLNPAYAAQAASVTRKATFNLKSGATQIDDHLKNPKGPVRWAVLTEAEVTISGNTVRFEQEGHRLIMQRHDESGGTWQLTNATPPSAAENQNEGVQVVSFTAPMAEHLNLQVSWRIEQ